MSQFLTKLIEQRMKLIEGLVANDGDINLDIFEDFYPDQAHFVFELLQNAEDAGATEAVFILHKNACVFEHNGTRAFTEADVKAITGIHNSTKGKALDQIGKFGVGFKSVFVYTQTPIVRSGNFAFKITKLVLPEEVERDPAIGAKTRFELPFNNPQKLAEVAYTEIDAGLNELAETTLLFLRNLESIRWQNSRGESGEVLRVRHSENHFEVLKQSCGDTTVSSHFLKFDQSVSGLEKQQVSAAYPLDFLTNVESFDPKKPLAKQLRIVPANPGRVAVFFPAEKETSGLRFHLHAPFVPELSRASIKETPVNQPLFHQLAALAAASLHQIRDLGLLTADFLSALPNYQDEIPPRYEGIRDAIIREMNEQPLTPTHTKSHAPAKLLLQAKAALKGLLSKDDLEFLVDYDEEPPQWAVAASQKNSNGDRFLMGLAIRDWDIENFIAVLVEKTDTSYSGPDEGFMAWFAGKSIEWHQHFYAILYKELQLDEDFSQLEDTNIVRLSNGCYTTGNNCFFPSDGVAPDEALPRVDRGVFSSGASTAQKESAKKLLEAIGVREVGEAEQVEAILKQRYADKNLAPKKADLKRFVSFLEKEPHKRSLFADYFIFERKNGDWGTPNQVFLDEPFMETGLSAYYDFLEEGEECVALADTYKDYRIEIKRLVKFAEAVGVRTRLEVTKGSCQDNPDWMDTLSHVDGKRSSPIDNDYVITGLDKLLAQPSHALSKLVWNTMRSLPSSPNRLQAIYQNNYKEGYNQADSQLVHQLRQYAWIPQVDGTVVRPADASRDLLPEGFAFDPGWPWLKAIHFGTEAVKKSEAYRHKKNIAEEWGCKSVEEAEKWRAVIASGISPEAYLEQQAQRQRSSQPEESVPDPDRRRKNVLANAEDVPSKESVLRERAIQEGMSEVSKKAKTYLLARYKRPEAPLECQCCHKEMPFQLRSSGEYYFEAIQCVDHMAKLHHENYLALCPTCAAMYKYVRDTDNAEMRRLIVEHDADDQAPAVKIPIRLDGRKFDLYFVGKHWFDLKAILSP